jgi:hypothetical protein
MGSGEQSHDAGALDGLRQLALMPGADAGAFGRQNFHVKINETAQKTGVFVIDVADLIGAKKTFFFFFRLIVIHKYYCHCEPEAKQSGSILMALGCFVALPPECGKTPRNDKLF